MSRFLSTIHLQGVRIRWLAVGIVVHDALSKWIRVVSGVPQSSMLETLPCIIFTSVMFDPVKNRLFANADITSPLAVGEPSDRPTVSVAASVNRDLVWIQEWCSRCMVHVTEPQQHQCIDGEQIQEC